MKFVIATQELNYLINKCQNVIPAKPTMPVLSNILIEAKDGELTLTATDLSVGVRCHTEAKILEEGVTTLPSKKLAPLVRELTAINVQVTTNEHHITEILADSSRFKLNGMGADEYPNLPDLSEATPVNLTQEQLNQMFSRTGFSVSHDNNRPELSGVFLEIENGKATFTGTDGKRLSKTYVDIDVDPSFVGGYIVPIKAVDEMIKNLDGEGPAKLYFLSDKIALETPNTLLVAKLLSGDYPDISRVIPQQSEAAVTLHREELMTLLRQVSLFAEEGHLSVRFTFGEGEVKLMANTMEIGEGKVSMPVNYHGPNIDIAFNPAFFLDILRHCKTESVTMGLTDSFNPGIITDAEDVDKPTSVTNPLYVLMPMRLKEES